jgi:hypothetical protein
MANMAHSRIPRRATFAVVVLAAGSLVVGQSAFAQADSRCKRAEGDWLDTLNAVGGTSGTITNAERQRPSTIRHLCLRSIQTSSPTLPRRPSLPTTDCWSRTTCTSTTSLQELGPRLAPSTQTRVPDGLPERPVSSTSIPPTQSAWFRISPISPRSPAQSVSPASKCFCTSRDRHLHAAQPMMSARRTGIRRAQVLSHLRDRCAQLRKHHPFSASVNRMLETFCRHRTRIPTVCSGLRRMRNGRGNCGDEHTRDDTSRRSWH